MVFVGVGVELIDGVGIVVNCGGLEGVVGPVGEGIFWEVGIVGDGKIVVVGVEGIVGEGKIGGDVGVDTIGEYVGVKISLIVGTMTFPTPRHQSFLLRISINEPVSRTLTFTSDPSV